MKYFIGIVAFLLMLVFYYKIQYDSIKKTTDAQIAVQNEQIKQYKKEAEKQAAIVSNLNNEYETNISAIRDSYNRLLKQSKASILPSNPSGPNGVESETLRFDRRSLDRAIQDYRLEIQTLIREGDECRAALNTAIEWSKEIDRQRQ